MPPRSPHTHPGAFNCTAPVMVGGLSYLLCFGRCTLAHCPPRRRTALPLLALFCACHPCRLVSPSSDLLRTTRCFLVLRVRTRGSGNEACSYVSSCGGTRLSRPFRQYKQCRGGSEGRGVFEQCRYGVREFPLGAPSILSLGAYILTHPDPGKTSNVPCAEVPSVNATLACDDAAAAFFLLTRAALLLLCLRPPLGRPLVPFSPSDSAPEPPLAPSLPRRLVASRQLSFAL